MMYPPSQNPFSHQAAGNMPQQQQYQQQLLLQQQQQQQQQQSLLTGFHFQPATQQHQQLLNNGNGFGVFSSSSSSSSSQQLNSPFPQPASSFLQPGTSGFAPFPGFSTSIPLPSFGNQSMTFATSMPATSTTLAPPIAAAAAAPSAHMPLMRTHTKRPRDADDVLAVSDAEALPPPIKRQHNDAHAASVVVPALPLANLDDIRTPTTTAMDEDTPMATSPILLANSPTVDMDSPLPSLSPTAPMSNGSDSGASSPVDGEIDTDRWNLSRLKLEVNEHYKPLLSQISSEQAKQAAGFDASIFRELQREYDQKQQQQQRRGHIVRAVWDKNAEHMRDLSTRCFPRSPSSPSCEEQGLVLWKKPQPIIAPAPSRFCHLELTEPEPPSPIVVRKSPIVTEVDDDEPATTSNLSQTARRSSASGSFSQPTSPTVPSDPSAVASSAPFAFPATANNHPAAAAAAATAAASSSSSAHVPLKKMKRRRESDVDVVAVASPTSTTPTPLKIEEIHDEDHDHKRAKVRPTSPTDITALDLTMEDSASNATADTMTDSTLPQPTTAQQQPTLWQPQPPSLRMW